MGKAAVITTDNFEGSTSNGVALLDFWAEWCGPCRMVGPSIDALAGEFEGKATIGKINVDNDPALAEKFSVSSIPTIVILKNGQEVNRFIGITAKDKLADALNAAL